MNTHDRALSATDGFPEGRLAVAPIPNSSGSPADARQAFDAAATHEPDEPTPLMREIPPGEPFPVSALGPLQTVAEAVHDIVQAPVAIGAQSALAVASLAAQALGDVETLGGPAPCSLFLLTVAASGERKSSCDRLLMQPVRAFERELADGSKAEEVRARNRRELWERERKRIMAEGSGTAQLADLEALGPEPEGPLSPIIILTEPTFEGVAKRLATSRPSQGIFSDEGGALLGGHSMKTENRMATLSGLSGMWDASPVNRTRAGDGTATYWGRRLCTHLMAQPVVAAGLLADPLANGQGFLARFLTVEPPSAIGTRLRHGHDPASDAALARFSARVGDMLRRELPLREGARNELELPTLALEPRARALLQAFADDVEVRQARYGNLDEVRPFASKAAEHAARLAGVLTLFRNPDADTIPAELMDAAVVLADFYIGEHKRLAGAATVSAETMQAERLLRWILDKHPEPFVSVAEMQKSGPFRESRLIRKLVPVLVAHRWLIPWEGGPVAIGGNRRREAWLVHGRQPS